MNRLKKLFSLILVSAIITITFFLIESCQNDIPTKTEYQSSNSFQNYFNSSIDFVLHHDITTTTLSRSATIKSDDAITIYVAFPDNKTLIKPTLSKIKTAADVIELIEESGADYSFDPNDEYPDSISLSNNKAKEALNPLVTESKKYLYSKGLSESDINEMLKENDVDETTLVPFVLALIEENNEPSISLANFPTFPNLFALNANAMTVDWTKVGNCALEAIGIDFIFCAGSSNLKTWSTAAIKRAFKPIAQRLLGPIGALIAVASFSYCLVS